VLLSRLGDILWRQPVQQTLSSVLHGKLEPDYSFGAGENGLYPWLIRIVDTARGLAKSQIGYDVERNKIKPCRHVKRSLFAPFLQLLNEIVRVTLEVVLLLAPSITKSISVVTISQQVGIS
jgi:hypothetical protein